MLRDTQSLEVLLDVVRTLQLPDPYPLNEGQKKAIKEAQAQIKNGETVPHNEVMNKAKKWLRSK